MSTTSNSTRQMSLVGFMQAGNVTVYSGSWRHPATEHGFLTGSFYETLGRTREEGCFDMMFFDDRLAMPGIYGGSVADAVRLGARPVKLDLSIVLGIVAGFVLFLFPDLLPIDTAVVTVFGFLAILAGFITLISRLRNSDEDRGPDDGAVV